MINIITLLDWTLFLGLPDSSHLDMPDLSRLVHMAVRFLKNDEPSGLFAGMAVG